MVGCLLPSRFDPEKIGKCIAEPDSEFMLKHGECVIGSLTAQEQEWSDRILKTWTNFAIHGYRAVIFCSVNYGKVKF